MAEFQKKVIPRCGKNNTFVRSYVTNCTYLIDYQQNIIPKQTLIDQDSVLKELFYIAECLPVNSVKGIGPVIATEVLITTNEFKATGGP